MELSLSEILFHFDKDVSNLLVRDSSWRWAIKQGVNEEWKAVAGMRGCEEQKQGKQLMMDEMASSWFERDEQKIVFQLMWWQRALGRRIDGKWLVKGTVHVIAVMAKDNNRRVGENRLEYFPSRKSLQTTPMFVSILMVSRLLRNGANNRKVVHNSLYYSVWQWHNHICRQ